MELLAISPPNPILGSHSAAKISLITKQQSFTAVKQRLSTSPKSIPISPTEDQRHDKEVITLSRSPSPTSNSTLPPVSTKLPTSEIKPEARIPQLPQFRVVSREHPEQVTAPRKRLWLEPREKGHLTQPERPPIIVFSPEKLSPTIQGRPSSFITQALLTEGKTQQGPLPANRAEQGDPKDNMLVTYREREVSLNVAFHPRAQSQFELPAGIPKMPGLIDLKLLKARAESNVTQSSWIPNRPVGTLPRSIMEKEREADPRLKQQSSLEHISLKTLLQQSAPDQEQGESGSQVQRDGPLQSLQQLALSLAPHKLPTASEEHHIHTTEPRGMAEQTGRSFKSSLQHPNSFSSRMKVVLEEQSQMMVASEEKKRKLSLSSGLSSSLSYEDEDDDDTPIVTDTDDSGKKTETDERTRLQLGKQQPQEDRTHVPPFHLTPLQEVKKEPWSFEGYSFNREQDASYLTPMEDDDLDDLDSLDRMVGLNQKRGNDPKQPEKVECPFCRRFYGKYYINQHMVNQHP